MRIVEIAPKPSSLVESMRDIGYSLSTALADLVDNCIAARAETVQVFASTEGSELKIGILDDGEVEMPGGQPPTPSRRKEVKEPEALGSVRTQGFPGTGGKLTQKLGPG